MALNAKATLVLSRSPYYGAKQKLFQLVLVWLLPIVGAVLVWSLATDTKSQRFTTDLQDRGGFDDGHMRFDDSSFDGGGGDGGGGGD
jgi:uncharacterized membrane protein YgcG